MSVRTVGRARRRGLWLGLLTVLGIAKRGYFIPHRYAGALAPAGTRPPYPAMESLFRAAEPRFREVLGWIGDFEATLAAIGEAPAPAPHWDQAWFPRLDAAAAYAITRRTRPARIVEVGSGHSTRFFAKALADGGVAARLVAIDPAPRATIDGLPVDLLRTTVQAAGVAPFAALAAGDILSVDSSHILMPGSDMDTLLGHVLPMLPEGVLVHVHDIFLPEDYPAAWAWRGYNEQLGIQALLLGGGWDVLFAARYVTERMAEALPAVVRARLPLPTGAVESSLWLRKG